jgi:hypothetical protein
MMLITGSSSQSRWSRCEIFSLFVCRAQDVVRSFLCSVLTHARLLDTFIYCTPQSADMSTEMSQEILELVTMAVDKFINVKNYEVNAYAKSISCQMSLHVALHLLCGRFHLP